MDKILITIGFAVLFIIVGILIYAIFKLSKKNDDLKEYLNDTLDDKQNELRYYNSTLLQTMSDIKTSLSDDFLNFNSKVTQDFNSLSDRTSQRINDLQNNISQNMLDNNRFNHDVLNNLNERIARIDETQKSLDSLSNDIISFQNIFLDKKTRGSFGEVELYSLLENVFGNNKARFDRQVHLNNGSIADAVIYGGDTLGMICVDSKFPLENYNRIYDTELSKEEHTQAKKAFKNDVLKHIHDISNKYIISGVTADFAYMFIPAEAVFTEIYGNYDEVIQESYKNHVYLVSPTTLMAYLTAIRSIYLGQQRDAKAKEIINELNLLSIDFDRFKQRQEKMDSLFKNLVDVFEQFKISSNKISNRFDKINKGDLNEEDN